MTWWLVDATCILMKSLIREQRIKTIQSEEQDKDSMAREKLELMLSGTQTLFDPSSRLRCDRIVAAHLQLWYIVWFCTVMVAEAVVRLSVWLYSTCGQTVRNCIYIFVKSKSRPFEGSNASRCSRMQRIRRKHLRKKSRKCCLANNLYLPAAGTLVFGDDDDVDHDSRDNVADGDNADGGDDEQEEDEGTFGINYTTVWSLIIFSEWQTVLTVVIREFRQFISWSNQASWSFFEEEPYWDAGNCRAREECTWKG